MSYMNGGKRGFTLIEVLMTVVIIGILAAVAMRSVQSAIESSRIRETQAEMDELTVAIAGNPDLFNNGMRSDFGYVGDVGAVPSSLDNLVTNPGGYATWKGPYVRRRFSEDSDGFKKDAWGTTYGFSNGITVSSTGGGATAMTKSAASAAADLTSIAISGTVTDAAGNPPGDSSIAVTVTVAYPNGSGGSTTSSTNPAAGGSFTVGSIPVGVRTVTTVYRATNDTVITYAAALPKTGTTLSVRLPGAPFAASGGGGGGGSSGGIEFVGGSASSPTQDINFTIWNTSSSSIAVTSLKATYTLLTPGYYRYIDWGSTNVFDSSNPRAAAGQTVTFTASQTIAANETVQVKLRDFKQTISGGANADPSNSVFTIEFSNGDTIAFYSN